MLPIDFKYAFMPSFKSTDLPTFTSKILWLTKSFVPGNYCFDIKIHISELHNYAHFTMRSGHITIIAHYKMRRNKSFSFTKNKPTNRKILELFSNQYSINKIAIVIRRFVCVCFINIKIKYVFRCRVKKKQK